MKPVDASISPIPSDSDLVLRDTLRWLERAIIGLNLCPFAKAALRKSQIRMVASDAQDTDALVVVLSAELQLLRDSESATIDTTLLIHPSVLNDFFDYNAFLAKADRLVEKLGLLGVIQIASFHPEYAFADCATEAIENYTNRSPYPMLHLLREESVAKAIEAFPEADLIYERNITTLRMLGKAGLETLLDTSTDE